MNQVTRAITTQAFHVGFRMEVMEVQCVLRAELLHGHLRMYAVSSMVPEPRSTQSSDSLAREMVCREELRKCGVRVTTPGVRPENKMI